MQKDTSEPGRSSERGHRASIDRKTGEVHGSGAGAGGGNPGEDYDNDAAAGDGDKPEAQPGPPKDRHQITSA